MFLYGVLIFTANVLKKVLYILFSANCVKMKVRLKEEKNRLNEELDINADGHDACCYSTFDWTASVAFATVFLLCIGLNDNGKSGVLFQTLIPVLTSYGCACIRPTFF